MRRVQLFLVAILASFVFGGVVLAQPLLPVAPRAPRIIGRRPPALAPFAPDDYIPEVSLRSYPEQSTPRQVAETFLVHLSKGYFVPEIGPISGGEPQGYEMAWALMGPERPALSEFKEQWKGTARMKVLQLVAAQENRFFVELQRMEYCGDHWAVSFYSGFLETMPTPEGWRVKSLMVQPEDLVGVNVAGHQGWQHDEILMAKWVLSRPPDDTWIAQMLRYDGRTVAVTLWHPSRKEVARVTLVRTMEGSWGLLQKQVKP